MNIPFYPHIQPRFTSNSRSYKAEDNNPMGTYTRLFRRDLDWQKFTDYTIKHFNDKENIQTIQFGASDGSEAYTYIISLLESGKEVHKFLPIKAYDIDKEVYNASKSGLINLNSGDISQLDGIDYKKYFSETSEKLRIEGDTFTDVNMQKQPAKSYKVSNVLTDKVEFNCADMFDVLNEHKDDSNTLLLCRNVAFFLSERELDRFTTLLGSKLKKGSLVVTGEFDAKEVNPSLEMKGFSKVMENVYMKT